MRLLKPSLNFVDGIMCNYIEGSSTPEPVLLSGTMVKDNSGQTSKLEGICRIVRQNSIEEATFMPLNCKISSA